MSYAELKSGYTIGRALVRAEAQKLHERGKTDGSTSFVRALRTHRQLEELILIGFISAFEARFEYPRSSGFAAYVRDELRLRKRPELGDDFFDLMALCNVLKHGKGRSFDQLRNSRKFAVWLRLEVGMSIVEGDVSAVQSLIDLDDSLLDCVVGILDSVAVEFSM